MYIRHLKTDSTVYAVSMALPHNHIRHVFVDVIDHGLGFLQIQTYPTGVRIHICAHIYEHVSASYISSTEEYENYNLTNRPERAADLNAQNVIMLNRIQTLLTILNEAVKILIKLRGLNESAIERFSFTVEPEIWEDTSILLLFCSTNFFTGRRAWFLYSDERQRTLERKAFNFIDCLRTFAFGIFGNGSYIDAALPQ